MLASLTGSWGGFCRPPRGVGIIQCLGGRHMSWGLNPQAAVKKQETVANYKPEQEEGRTQRKEDVAREDTKISA